MPLREKRILVAEDDYVLAQELSEEIGRSGATVVGPAATVSRARILARELPIDIAVLDVNLAGEMVFPLADELAGRGTALVFSTGYDVALIPRRFAQYATCEKPTTAVELVRGLANAIRPPWLVAVGASGPEGLTDLQRLLHALPEHLNAIVMVVLHRPWHAESHLRQILAQDSPLPVEVARDRQPIGAGRIHLGEPSCHLKLGWGGRAELVSDPDRHYGNRTVDLLFNSLAERGAGRTIGVILSGSLSDGSRGLEALKAAGGLAMTVPPEARNERGMVRNAGACLASVDFVGSPDHIGAEIARIVRDHPHASLHADPEPLSDLHTMGYAAAH